MCMSFRRRMTAGQQRTALRLIESGQHSLADVCDMAGLKVGRMRVLVAEHLLATRGLLIQSIVASMRTAFQCRWHRLSGCAHRPAARSVDPAPGLLESPRSGLLPDSRSRIPIGTRAKDVVYWETDRDAHLLVTHPTDALKASSFACTTIAMLSSRAWSIDIIDTSGVTYRGYDAVLGVPVWPGANSVNGRRMDPDDPGRSYGNAVPIQPDPLRDIPAMALSGADTRQRSTAP